MGRCVPWRVGGFEIDTAYFTGNYPPGEMIGAIGVGGAPGGDKDDVCAMAGVAKVKDRL